jgi:hypothetical protein
VLQHRSPVWSFRFEARFCILARIAFIFRSLAVAGTNGVTMRSLRAFWERFSRGQGTKGLCENKSVVSRRNCDIVPGSVIEMAKVEECSKTNVHRVWAPEAG